MALRDSFLLWLPSSMEDELFTDAAEKVTKANGAILDFCDGYSDLDETLQIIESYDADVDDYLINLAEIVRVNGG